MNRILLSVPHMGGAEETYVHLAPQSTLGSRVEVRSFALIGIGASAIPGITIGEGAIVGADAVVVEDVPRGVTAIGVPARFRVSK